MKYTESIIQKDLSHCIICRQNGSNDRLEIHHIFGGAYRKKSEQYGLKVALCGDKCHRNGEYSVHGNRIVDLQLKQYAQRKAMKHYGWSKEEFIELFGKNYLEE